MKSPVLPVPAKPQGGKWGFVLLVVSVAIGLTLLLLIAGAVLFFGSAGLEEGHVPMPIPSAGAEGFPVGAALVLILLFLCLLFGMMILLMLCMCVRSGGGCGCGKGRDPTDLLKLLPRLNLLAQVPDALRATAIALKKSGEALDWVGDNLDQAGNFLNEAGTKAGEVSIPVPEFESTPVGTTGWYIIKQFRPGHISPLTDLKTKLNLAAGNLKGHSAEIDQVKGYLGTAARSLDGLANALDP